MSSKDEYVYELKYLKINSFNNTELLDQNDIVDFMTYDGDIQSEIESDDSESLQKYYKKIFPTITQDLLKTNYEQMLKILIFKNIIFKKCTLMKNI